MNRFNTVQFELINAETKQSQFGWAYTDDMAEADFRNALNHFVQTGEGPAVGCLMVSLMFASKAEALRHQEQAFDKLSKHWNLTELEPWRRPIQTTRDEA